MQRGEASRSEARWVGLAVGEDGCTIGLALHLFLLVTLCIQSCRSYMQICHVDHETERRLRLSLCLAPLEVAFLFIVFGARRDDGHTLRYQTL